MLDYARKAARLAAERTAADLDSDELFSLAMTRLLEVLGEAASRVGRPHAINTRNSLGSRLLGCATA